MTTGETHLEPEAATPKFAGAESYPITRVVESIDSGVRHVQIVGATGGFRASTLADLSRRTRRPILIVAPSPRAARAIARDLEVFTAGDFEDESDLLDDVALFPEFDVGPYHGSSPDRKLTMERLTTIYKLTRDRPPRFVVTSIRAAMRRTLPFDALARYSREYVFGDEIPNDVLRTHLTQCGYTEVDIVEDPGSFAIRGDIVDLYTPLYKRPIRIERWGDEISELRMFDPTTQRTTDDDVEVCAVFPVREEILTEAAVKKARSTLLKLGGERSIPTRTIQNILNDLDAGMHFVGIDAILPALHDELDDLFDHAPERALVCLVEPDHVLEQALGLDEKRASEFVAATDEHEVIFPVESYYRSSRQTVDWIKGRSSRIEFRRVPVAPVPTDDGLVFELPDEDASFDFRARANTDIVQIRKRQGGIDETVKALKPDLDHWKSKYGRICIICRTSGQVERLEKLLANFDFDSIALEPPIDVSEPVPPPAGLIEIYPGEVTEGFRSELLGICLIAGQEIFGNRVATATTAHSLTEQASISHFRDLTAGDLVVHVDFGIGRYHGLVHLDVEGVENDFLHLEYAGGDKLYLPVYRLGRVQKYIGSPDGVRIDKLGGTSWERTKERVKENIREVAQDLLRLYAERELRRGYAFSSPDEYFHQFEAAFPFEETPDQARAIAETLADMQRPRPMDRLVCGDVGFGKTEVAIRAAMKAALDGRQVAVLVPTTILCEQHLKSFRDRCEEFGVRVEALSRFRTTSEANDIIEATLTGKVDILIGTHRILSKKVEFRDLGLLVVDEEQRFGVVHKDKIKTLKANIDVLTLTATPIPRTLQMSLLGIRDLSIIATPPHDRLAVRTHLARFNDHVIREAIMRELGRGGQVFFVHNRVKTIEEMKEHLEKIVPESRIAVAHGQMGESKLEEVMVSYIKGKTNVLLASSIIESGLDIPNANTIIVNRADRFGLSQLYQLRGRVGRGKERAFAYLLIPARTKLKADAEKRLEVIETYTELGSGFQVATYDLEIRGAGNLLGDNQSGHVAAVGLDLYTDLLEEAIDDMREEEAEAVGDVEPEVNVPIPTFISEAYIPATSLRLMFYKRFSLARSLDELFETYGELTDRFGEPPEPVKNLRDLIELKVMLRDLRARRLDVGPSAIRVELDPTTPVRPDRIVDFMNQSRGKLKLTNDMRLIWRLLPDESAKPLESARQLLRILEKMRE